MQEQFTQSFAKQKENEEILPYEELIIKENSIDNIIADSTRFIEFYNVIYIIYQNLKNNLDKIIDDILNKNFKENLKITQKALRTSSNVNIQAFGSNINSSDPRDIKMLLNK